MDHFYKSTKKLLLAYYLLFFILIKGISLFSINSTNALSSESVAVQCAVSIPENISVINVFTTSITLQWDEIDGVAYTCKWRIDGTKDDWIDIVSYENQITLSGLEKSTTYEFRVRSDCVNEENSDLSMQSEFSESYIFITTEHDSYCMPKSNALNHYIVNFELGLIDNSSIFNELGYQNFSDIEMVLINGVSYDFSIKTLSNIVPSRSVKEIYIDLNHDRDFNDAGELVFNSKQGQNALPISESISLPDNYREGRTRMRIISRVFSGGFTQTPCNVESGETEDYGIVLVKMRRFPARAQEGDDLIFNVEIGINAPKDIMLRASTKHITTTSEDFVENEFEYSLGEGENWKKNNTDPNLLTIPAGYKKLKIKIATIEDDRFEPNDSLLLSLSTEVEKAEDSGAFVLGIIENDDNPPILSLKQNPKVTEGDLMVITAILDHQSELSVVINEVTLTPKSADASDYYQSTLCTPIIFEPGETIKTFTIQTNEDDIFETDQEFEISLSEVTNATIGLGTVTATIFDDDSPKGIFIYPIPFSNCLNIELPRRNPGYNPAPTQILIYKSNGEVVYSNNFPEHETFIRIYQYELKGIVSKVYFLRIKTPQWTVTYKILTK